MNKKPNGKLQTKCTTMIDGDFVIQKQLSCTGQETLTFPDGRKTDLHAVSLVTQLSDSQLRLSLDGNWQISRWPFSEPEDKLVTPSTCDSLWETLSQPGIVFTEDPEQVESSVPGWDRIGQTHIHEEDGAVMRRCMVIPDGWANKRIYLTFDAIYPGGRVYLNGDLLGEHTSGLTPVEWDVTSCVSPGQPVLVAVRLLRRHPFIKMDMPRQGCEYAGLAQSAYFHATEPCQIKSHHLVASLDSDFRKATISGPVTVRNLTQIPYAGELEVSLTDPQGRYTSSIVIPIESKPEASLDVPVDLKVVNPQLWNDEFPNLYQVCITLKLVGLPPQKVCYRTGFRRLDFDNGRPLLNGGPVKFRGVGHISYHPDYGLHTPFGWLKQCLELMKKANVNCIRAHYTGPRSLSELCDELGIYLIQEIAIDWGTDYIADPLWVGPALQRIQGAVLRDRHHPSIMVWGIGNENMPSKQAEAEDGYNHMRIYERLVKQLDPTRATIFPPPGPANTLKGVLEVRLGDIADTHYTFKQIREFLETGVAVNPIAWDGGTMTTTREEAIARGWSGSWFASEHGIANLIPDLLNAPYGDIINDVPVDDDSDKSTLEVFTERLRREWGFMRDEPTCLGGAFFPWLCSATGTNPWGWTVWSEDNDWGVVTADLLPKPFFWAMRVIFSPVCFPERIPWVTGETSVNFTIKNQFNAIDLRDCKLRVMMSWGKKPSTRDWREIPVSCAPGESTSVEVPLWSSLALDSLNQNYVTVLRVVLLDPKGFRVITSDILITPSDVKNEINQELLIGPDVTFA